MIRMFILCARMWNCLPAINVDVPLCFITQIKWLNLPVTYEHLNLYKWSLWSIFYFFFFFCCCWWLWKTVLFFYFLKNFFSFPRIELPPLVVLSHFFFTCLFHFRLHWLGRNSKPKNRARWVGFLGGISATIAITATFEWEDDCLCSPEDGGGKKLRRRHYIGDLTYEMNGERRNH